MTSSPSPPPLHHCIANHIFSPVSQHYTPLPLLLCCLISGLSDSAAYNAWSTFISMQTGNTIFLALGASEQPFARPYGWVKSLVSIACFCLGCAAFANAMRAFDRYRSRRQQHHQHQHARQQHQRPWVMGRSRAALAASFAVQSACTLVAAALVQGGVVPVPVDRAALDLSEPWSIELVPLAVLAFQAGGQIVASRILGHGEIPTTVLTSVYCDLVSDERIGARDNAKRDRRLGGIVCLLVGGIAGGWISRSKAGMAAVFWLAGALKLAISVGWLFWKEDEEIAKP